MDKLVLGPVTGMKDITSDEYRNKKKLMILVEEIFENYGAEPLETPVLEKNEVVNRLYGEEFEKTVFNLYKNKNILRYDLTVPFSRYVAKNSIVSMKRYTFGKVYRRDKSQISKGRYREFMQADFDIVGNPTTGSYLQEYEIINLIVDVFKKILGDKFRIKINTRQNLYKLLEDSGLNLDNINTVCSTLDKYVDDPLLKSKLLGKNIDQSVIDNICIKINEIRKLSSNINIIEYLAGYDTDIFRMLVSDPNLAPFIMVDPFLARGLDYYTGLVYEVVYEDEEFFGSSIAAGGRYDNLVERLCGVPTPMIGVSFGLDRLYDLLVLLNDKWLVTVPDIKYYVASIGPNLDLERMRVATFLRDKNLITLTNYDTNPKFKKQITQAINIGAKYLIIVDSSFVDGYVSIKDLDNKVQKTVILYDYDFI